MPRTSWLQGLEEQALVLQQHTVGCHELRRAQAGDGELAGEGHGGGRGSQRRMVLGAVPVLVLRGRCGPGGVPPGTCACRHAVQGVRQGEGTIEGAGERVAEGIYHEREQGWEPPGDQGRAVRSLAQCCCACTRACVQELVEEVKV